MMKIRSDIVQVEGELIEAKKMLNEKRRARRRTRSAIERDNISRMAATLEKTVAELKDHRSVLEEIEVPQWKVDLYLEQNPGVGLVSRSR